MTHPKPLQEIAREEISDGWSGDALCISAETANKLIDRIDAAEAEIERLKDAALDYLDLRGTPHQDEWVDGGETFQKVCVSHQRLLALTNSDTAQPRPQAPEDVVRLIVHLSKKYPGEMRVREEYDSEHRVPRYFVDYLGTNEPVVLEIAGHLEKNMARLIAALFNNAANLLHTEKEKG